jgi:uncharacterized protein (DUF433 family)
MLKIFRSGKHRTHMAACVVCHGTRKYRNFGACPWCDGTGVQRERNRVMMSIGHRERPANWSRRSVVAEKIQRLANGRRTRSKLASMIGCPVSQVYSAFHYLRKRGISVDVPDSRRHSLHHGRNAKIVAARQSGKTSREIALRYGLSHQRVQQICRKMGVSGDVSVRKSRRNARIVAARQSGETLQAIALRYGVSRERIRQIWLRAAGSARLKPDSGEQSI